VFSEYSAVVAVAIHDETYLLDFSVKTVNLQAGHDVIADHVIKELESYEKLHLAKFIGAGIPFEVSKKCPKLCSRLWLELDIVPITIMAEVEGDEARKFWGVKDVDEQADSMARKCRFSS